MAAVNSSRKQKGRIIVSFRYYDNETCEVMCVPIGSCTVVVCFIVIIIVLFVVVGSQHQSSQ
jgi:hypothetical protein